MGTTVSTVDGGANGIVVGVAHSGPPGVGVTYIVKLEQRTDGAWKNYPYDCAAIPRPQLRVHGTENIVANYEGDVQFYEENQKVPILTKACNIKRKLYEPYTLDFSFADEGDSYVVKAEMHAGVWSGTYDLSEEGRLIYHGALYHVMVEDRQGTLILNASMEEAGSPQHITLRAKCIGEKAEIEIEDSNLE
jgi:hypothetical protein